MPEPEEDFTKKFFEALEKAETTNPGSSQDLFDQFSKQHCHDPKEVLNYLNKSKKTHNLHYDGVPISTPEDFEE